MKNIYFLLVLLFAFSCNSDDDAKLETDPETNKVALLKVDFLTNQFEGGKEFEFSQAADFTISSTYEEPGDFGSIQLYYDELNEKIFDGTIIWMGKGEMIFPEEINSPTTFSTLNTPIQQPDDSSIELVQYHEFSYYPEDIDYTSIWNAINNLQIVKSYRNSNPNTKINLFLYTPSVGVGDPADWDWYIYLKN